MTLILIGLAGGIITGVTPCVLPVLPAVLLGSADHGRRPGTRRRRGGGPTWSILGLVLSFAVFTLFGDLILDSLHLPQDAIRWAGLVLLRAGRARAADPAAGAPASSGPSTASRSACSAPAATGSSSGSRSARSSSPAPARCWPRSPWPAPPGTSACARSGSPSGFAVGTAIPLLAFALAGPGHEPSGCSAFRRRQGVFRAVSGVVMIALAVALTFNLSDLIQRDLPNYAESAGNSLERGASGATGGGASGGSSGGSGAVSLQDCQTAALYGGTGSELEDCGNAPAFSRDPAVVRYGPAAAR